MPIDFAPALLTAVHLALAKFRQHRANAGVLRAFVFPSMLFPVARVELLGTCNRGRSLDARRLTEDMLNHRALTARDVEGLRYEGGGGRVTIERPGLTDVAALHGGPYGG